MLPAFEPEPGQPPDALDASRGDELHRSQIGATILVSLSAIASRIASEVPPQAAASRVNVGAAGLLTYTARRTPFTASLRGQRLHFTSQINATAEVCKPLGPLGCVVYAECQPAAVADASLGLEPATDWSLGPSRVVVAMTRSCTLGPIDATSMIQRGANQQAAALRAKIDASLPSLLRPATAIWRAARLDAELGAQHLRFDPDQMTVGTPVIQGDIASIPVVVRGAAVPGSAAAALASPPNPPPPRSDPKSAAGIVVRAPLLLDSRSLSQSLVQNLTPLAISAGSARAAPVTVEAHPMSDGLRFELQLGGDVCGRIPFIATPALDRERGAVRLDDVKVMLSARSPLTRALPDLDQRQLELAIQQRVSIPIPTKAEAVAELLGRSTDKIRPDGAATVELGKPAATFEGITLAPQGIFVWATVRQDARIEVR
ncbi:MAG: DUF4403 family protein [Deltaproteobacteria bacterium]|nr:DUF4403 family protein [Deltaproteobacteria bacterium]